MPFLCIVWPRILLDSFYSNHIVCNFLKRKDYSDNEWRSKRRGGSMPRAKGGFKTRRYHKKVLVQAKGYIGGRNRLYTVASQAVDKALVAAYKDRRLKKREFRSLWIARINAAVRSLGLSYSQFMDRINKAGIDLDRKSLAELAYGNPQAFGELVKQIVK